MLCLYWQAISKFPQVPQLQYVIEVKYIPFVPNNIRSCQVFEDDQKLKIFLEVVDEFYALHINQDNELEGSVENKKFQESIADHKIIELKGNHLPKGLVPLEKLFNNHDVLVKTMMQSIDESVVNVNIGTRENPKYVEISKSLTEE